MATESYRDEAGPATVRSRITRHLNDNASEILYGAVLAAAALAVASAQPAKTTSIALSIVVMLTVYSLAHLYAKVLGSRMTQPGATVWQRVRSEAEHEAAVVEGGLPVLLCFIVLRVAGVPVAESAHAASWFTVALLAYIGYRIGRSSNATGLRLALEITGAAAIGLLLIALKALLY